MGMNETPSANRVHIGIFGRRNAGKSSLLNAVTGQNLAVVSDVKGTTTDPVIKAMELLPLGPVVLIDTPGIDDEGLLGQKRMEKSDQILNKTDLAIFVLDGAAQMGKTELDNVEKQMIARFAEKKIPYMVAVNKSEVIDEKTKAEITGFFGKDIPALFVSAKTGYNIYELKETAAKLLPAQELTGRIVGDFLDPYDLAVLVVPLDASAPKGRLILPQQQVIRDCLEVGAIPVVTKETELLETFRSLAKKPKVVITDSQAFERVSKETPEGVFLTSFSILFSRLKGDLEQQVLGAKALRLLKDGDTALICEGCTHHRQCEDIGTVKLLRWIERFTGKKIHFQFTGGGQFPKDLSRYALIVHCGGCTLNEREMKYRLKCAKDAGVPVTNYGLAIAYMHGILDRSLEIFR